MLVKGGGINSTFTINWNGKDNNCDGIDDNGIIQSPEPNTSVMSRSSGLDITGSTQVCSGMSTTLTANNGSVYTQWWKEGSDGYGILVNTGKSYTTSITSTTDIYVCDPIEVTGCSKKEHLTITVKPSLSVTSNGSPASNPVIRTGQSVSLSAIGSGTFSWNTNPVRSGSTITVSPTATTTYTVSGGSSTCRDASITVVVDNTGGGTGTGNGTSTADEACSAKEIAIGNTVTLSITSQTTTSNVPLLYCDGTSGRDVWATFTMPVPLALL